MRRSPPRSRRRPRRRVPSRTTSRSSPRDPRRRGESGPCDSPRARVLRPHSAGRDATRSRSRRAEARRSAARSDPGRNRRPRGARGARCARSRRRRVPRDATRSPRCRPHKRAPRPATLPNEPPNRLRSGTRLRSPEPRAGCSRPESIRGSGPLSREATPAGGTNPRAPGPRASRPQHDSRCSTSAGSRPVHEPKARSHPGSRDHSGSRSPGSGGDRRDAHLAGSALPPAAASKSSLPLPSRRAHCVRRCARRRRRDDRRYDGRQAREDRHRHQDAR